jgi:hypothetical protein
MNDFNDPTTPGPYQAQYDPTHTSQNPDQPLAFCQNCGKSLNADTVRKVGAATFCEPCLEARLADPQPVGAPINPPPPPSGSTAYTYVGATYPGALPPNPGPNPGLAFILGLIPGVGAMYNEQYAKGVVHLAIFAVLVTLANAAGIFGLFVAGWIFYMAIEAHHTAKARRDGTPLPNPFGFNDIAERFGFGKAWLGTGPAPDFASAARDAAAAATAGINAAAAGFNRPPIITPAPDPATWSTPAYTAQPPHPYTQPYAYTAPYIPVAAPPMPFIPPVAPNRFPTGAIWLIGLGIFFLLSTMGLFNAVSGEALLGAFLFALGGWIFFRRMLETGPTLSDDGAPNYQFRVLRALRGSVWLLVLGLLFLLEAFHILSWNSSWPALLILAGLMMILERTVYARAPIPNPYPAQPLSSSYQAGGPGQPLSSSYEAGGPSQKVSSSYEAGGPSQKVSSFGEAGGPSQKVSSFGEAGGPSQKVSSFGEAGGPASPHPTDSSEPNPDGR